MNKYSENINHDKRTRKRGHTSKIDNTAASWTNVIP